MNFDFLAVVFHNLVKHYFYDEVISGALAAGMGSK